MPSGRHLLAWIPCCREDGTSSFCSSCVGDGSAAWPGLRLCLCQIWAGGPAPCQRRCRAQCCSHSKCWRRCCQYCGDLARAVAAQLAEAEVGVLPHQPIPELLLVRSHRPNLHLTEWNRVRPHSPRYRVPRLCLSSPLPNLFPDQIPTPNIEKPCAIFLENQMYATVREPERQPGSIM